MQDGGIRGAPPTRSKLVGDELHISNRRNAKSPAQEMVAHRVPAGEGAMPARQPLPALHKVPDNGLAHAAHGLEQLEQIRAAASTTPRCAEWPTPWLATA